MVGGPVLQKQDFDRIRADWERDHPNETCAHVELDQEYDLGGTTGDWCCVRCGSCARGSTWSRP